MHANADTNQLLNGLDVLSKSIDQKSASLKVLVESNFERFVRAKATIDNVYKEMKYRGVDPTPPRARAHSRHASRNSFRSGSGNQIGLNLPPTPISADPRKKNALIKESEYGVMGVKTPLLDVSAKAEDVWGPALGGREKEGHLKTVASSLDGYRQYVETSAVLADSIKRKDYESLVEEYTKARRFADEARQLAQEVGDSEPTDDQAYRIILAGRMWHDVEEQIQLLKRDVWKRLISPQNVAKAEVSSGQRGEQHMELIALLLELGVDDNPVWVWLLSRYDYLKVKIQSTVERSKVEIEILRRRLANGEKPSPQAIATHMKALGRQSLENKSPTFDSVDVVELWEMMVGFVNNLLSPQGIMGEVLEFWQTVQGFIDGKTQRTLPVGFNGESKQHHRLSVQGTADLQKGTIELVGLLREAVFMFLAGPPPEDISLLFSPLPPSPATPNVSSTPRDPRFNLDPNNIPPPSPKRGEAWEKFAFWPPWSNSISGVHFLSKMLALVGTGAAEMAFIAPVTKGNGNEVEQLKSLVNVARERCVTALCAAWNRDAENIKFVEDWNRSPDRHDITKMPSTFSAFEQALLAGMQKILFISEAASGAAAAGIVLPPPPKLLQMVRSQYVTTLYKALSGMVENAERPLKKGDDDWTLDPDGYVAPSRAPAARPSTVGGGSIDAGDRVCAFSTPKSKTVQLTHNPQNVRMLLTLGNLQALKGEMVPNLNTNFENAFSVKLTEETKTIRDVLTQIDTRLFQSYTRPSIENIRKIVRAGVSDPNWAPPRGEKPREVRPYVYQTLLGLVLVHTQVSTTAPTLTGQILSYLLEQTTKELLEAFKTRPKYQLEDLMQATLDVEFIAQTLSHFTTDRASELQGLVYAQLDGCTDGDARVRLQTELPEMSAVLKRLREASKVEFACFRKQPKQQQQQRSGAGSGDVAGQGGGRRNTAQSFATTGSGGAAAAQFADRI